MERLYPRRDSETGRGREYGYSPELYDSGERCSRTAGAPGIVQYCNDKDGREGKAETDSTFSWIGVALVARGVEGNAGGAK